MGLESTTYISGFTASWPEGTDQRKQGDDHIRLIKGVLQATFPNADKAFRFPSALAKSANYTILSTNQNATIYCDTTAGDFTLTLPSLAAGDAGWSCKVTKTSTDANGVLVAAAAGNITSKVGAVATVRVGVLAEPAEFFWTGTAWLGHKPGPMIGSTEEFDGASLPPGYLWADGATFSGTAFAELALVLGGTTKTDKRGRVSAGQDDMGGSSANRLTGLTGGLNGDTLGATGGEEAHTLLEASIPVHTHAFTGNALAPHKHTTTLGNVDAANGIARGAVTGSGSVDTDNVSAGTPSGTNANYGGGGAHNNVQPTIVVNKIIRAC